MSTLKGQTILIIGGSAGIGYGVALASLQSGASKVIIASHTSTRLSSAVIGLNSEKGASEGVVEAKELDARDLDSVKGVVESVGEIDHLVFSSGDHSLTTEFKGASVEGMKGACQLFLFLESMVDEILFCSVLSK